ncbi:hypothetical protein PAESOLCIP111_04332 [Paenibacillus solanacearum]|uniref:DUF5054 domain-containing protein n=1 Tax=Paenibacillus solanacearum TaxID=2048548 RepID=A0A916K5Q4_9BACL|nr:DUF5054 domain-containing protein [Paenibacillus solanacearum]CAG7642376.1 hypothetical protein PAESOLCIP111_04332 [Paenibacillus solanacearum]
MEPNVKLEKIYVVFKTHFDIGFTGLASDVVSRYSSDMLKEVNEICNRTSSNKEHEKYVWTMSSWPLLQSIEGSSAEDREQALAFLEDRQLIWHMLPFTTHTEFCGLEEWVRGMYISRHLTERYGYKPTDAKMTDVPGHTWSVPSLLKKAGVHILHLGCNGFSTPPDVPPVFFWEGPDGERLLTFYSKGGYGTGILPPDEWTHPVWLAMIQTNDNHGPHEASIVDEMKASIAAKGLHDTELHIGSLGDFAEDFLSRNPDLPVIRGDLADAWIHGVGTAPRGVSRVRELRGRIAAAESALSLHMVDGAIGGEQAAAVKRLLDDSYEHTLLFGEHTWGMDCKTFLFPRKAYDKASFQELRQSERYRLMEQSWQEQIDYVNRAERSLTEALALLGASGGADAETAGEAAMELRAADAEGAAGGRDAEAVGTLSPPRTGQMAVAGADASTGQEVAAALSTAVNAAAAGTPAGAAAGNIGKTLRAYNHLGWSRDLRLGLTPEQLPLQGEALVDCATGEALRVVASDDTAYVDVKGMPALGYKTLAYVSAADASDQSQAQHRPAGEQTADSAGGGLLQASLQEEEAVLENELYTVKVCRRTGWLSSLYDKRLAKEWIEQPEEREAKGAGFGFGQYEYNIYSNRDITRYIKKYAYRFYDWGVHDFGKTDYPEAQRRLSFTTVLKDFRLIEERDRIKVECTAGTPGDSVTEYGNARDIVWSVTLTRDAHIDMEWRLLGKAETPLAESGHIVFPLKLDRPSYRINKMGSVVDPCADLVPYSGTMLHCCEHFVDVSDGTAGLAIVPLDSPLLWIGRNGMWDYEPDYKPEKPELNFNLFNNWWGTNFPQWIGGDLTYRFRLIPHQGDWREGAVWKAAEEARAGSGWAAAASAALRPDTAAFGTDNVRSTADTAATLELLPGGVPDMAVTCFKPAEDGDGFIVRLRDWRGEARTVAIAVGDAVAEVLETDLLEYGGETLPLRCGPAGRELRLQTAGFEVHTLRIRL